MERRTRRTLDRGRTMSFWANRRLRGLLIGAGLVAVVGTGLAMATRVTPGDAGDARQLARGREIYVTYCAACHGANLEGEPDWKQPRPDGSMPAPPHDATGHTWHHADDLLFQIVAEGGQSISPPGYVNRMPAFGEQLGDEEIWAVLAYIKSTWPEENRLAQEDVTRRSR
jgi:mono/diheme cytochrome c family protein